MATLSITSTVNYPDARAAEFRDTLAEFWGWQATVNGSPNPVSKTQFVTAFIQQSQDNHMRSLIRDSFKVGKELSQAVTNTIELT